MRAGSTPTALFVACTAIWGSTWLAITYQLGIVAPEASVAYRFARASVLLAAWCIATGRSLRFGLRTHGLLVAQGLLVYGQQHRRAVSSNDTPCFFLLEAALRGSYVKFTRA